MRNLLLITLLVASTHVLCANEKPTGKFLFQPMLIWATSEVTHQGTGYLLKHENHAYGVTSIHFLDFDAGGLFEAIWLDVHSSKPIAGFRTSAGKPKTTSIQKFEDIQNDFLIMPLEKIPDGCVGIEIEKVAHYSKGHKLWFPNKAEEESIGYTWVEAEIVEDKGHMMTARLLSEVKLQGRSGSPFFSQETGKAIGMLMGGDENEIYLCPTRGIVDSLESNPTPIPLMESITNR
ncbi:hypothetical protein SAMN02745166_03835 [Prosthecobacter debontii]|uniref:Trypsin-like peptidase domain-containing protein n=1 Tax=Prosthecobacter debontii TaxID=48467 RepID=A0A1T4YNX2_9BACT|nr:hypothetical protein [Prosthecobacter debontii]SKB03534.1 hypothetical protein SAMN02745166_03835 [Prosthecobacter debontii]